MEDIELARRHIVYTFNTTTATKTNDEQDIKVKISGMLGGVSIKRKNCMYAVFQKGIEAILLATPLYNIHKYN